MIRLDPDEGNSRVRLGHRRSGGGWAPPSGPVPDVRDDWTRERWREYRKVRSEYLAAFSSLLSEEARRLEAAAGREDPAGAKAAKETWYEVLRCDPGNGAAREALGYGKLDVSWTTAPTRSREERMGWLAEIREQAWTDIPLPRVGERIRSLGQRVFLEGVPQAASDLFIVDSSLEERETAALLRFCHKAVGTAGRLGLLLEDAVPRSAPWNFVVVRDKENYDEIAGILAGDDARKRDMWLSFSGFYPEPGVYVCMAEDLLTAVDMLLHKASEHHASFTTLGKVGDWYEEGVAFMVVEALEGRSAHACAGGGSRVKREPFGKPADWGGHLLEALSTGATHELGSIFRMEATDLDRAGVLQAWSFLWWARETDPRRLAVLIRFLRDGADPETALLNAFGCPGSSVERAWLDWIREQYIPAGKRVPAKK